MRIHGFCKSAMLSAAIMVALAGVAMADTVPMSGAVVAGFRPHTPKDKKTDDKKTDDASKSAPMFPKATRKDPNLKPSSGMADKLKHLSELDEQKKNDEVIALGQQIAGDPTASKYDRALADNLVEDAYISKTDYANAIVFAQKAVTEDALSNNTHYQLMLQLAQMQVSQEQFDAGIATTDRLITETAEDKPDYEALRGDAFYQSKRYPQAVEAMNKAIAGSPKPQDNWMKITMASYFNMKEPLEAAKVAEGLLKKNPDDKDLMINLSSIYIEANQPEKATALLDSARQRGLLTDEKDYKQLYSLYANIKGHEKDSIAVINEGLQKNILKPDAGVYTVLAQDYYFSGQTAPALDAYQKADATSTDGEAALNMAKIYSNDGRSTEAKAAAERALRKGIKEPEEARGIIQRTSGAAVKSGKKK